MEIPHLNSDDTESLSDTTKKKEKKAKKAAPFIHVPVPVQIEAAKNVPPEAERAMAELGDDDKTKKRKKSKQKVAQAALIDTESKGDAVPVGAVIEQTAREQEAIDDTTEDEITDEDDDSEEAETTVGSPEVRATPKQEEFQGELLVSDRARRLRELEEQARMQAEAEQNAEIIEEQADRAILEQLASEIAELDDETLSAESIAEESDEPEDDITSPPSRTTARTSARRGSGSGTTPPAAVLTAPAPVTTTTPIPPVPVRASAGSGGSIPPVPFTAAAPNMYPASPNVMAVPLSNPVEAVSTRGAEQRGLLAGLLVGGMIEHVRHKRRERRMEKQQAEALKTLSGEQQAAALRAAEREKAAGRKQTALESQLARLKEQIVRTAPEQSRTTETIPEKRQIDRAEQMNRATNQKSPEDAAKARAELERMWAADEAAALEKQREIPDDRRIETSAWHAIEVDKKTGKAVENPTLEYGEEFKYEQHQEQLRREVEAASIESASMRQRYVDPHIQRPSQQEYTAMGAPDQSSDVPNELQPMNQQSESGSGISVIDIVLWAILGIIVVVIVSVLSS